MTNTPLKLLAGIATMLLATTAFAQDSRSLRDYLNQSPEYRQLQHEPSSNGCEFSRRDANESRDFAPRGNDSFGYDNSLNFSNSLDLDTRGQSYEELRNRFHGPNADDRSYSGDYQTRRPNSNLFDQYRNSNQTDFGSRTVPARYRSETVPRDFDSQNYGADHLQNLRDMDPESLERLREYFRSEGTQSRDSQQFDRPNRPNRRDNNDQLHSPERWRNPDRLDQNRPSRPSQNFDTREQRNYGPRRETPNRENTRGRYEDLAAPGRYQPQSPQRGLGNTSDVITDIRNSMTRRYSDPSVQRFLQTLTPNQSLQLHSEISQMIDQRHYQPVSYDVRMNRVIQHLNEAVNNQAFLTANRVSTSNTAAFRSQLTRYSGSVNSLSEMQAAMRSLMAAAQQNLGINPSVIAYEFIVASIDPLDKYSAFEPEDPGSVSGAELETDIKTAGLDDVVVGIGVQIKEHADGLLIEGILRNGPAYEAGLKKGDVIVGINGRSIGGMTLAAAADMISGREGTPVMLEVASSGRSTQSISLRRRRIKVLAVNEARMLEPRSGVGYLKLDKFNSTSSEEIDQALWSLHRQGMKSLVFDLRGNPGGLLNECVDICNKFVPCGTIVSTRGRLASDNTVEKATYSQTWKTPIVVLVDGNSASASEIFAAAIQDNGRGLILGEKSYGKGTVQTHFPLNSVRGKLRLTTARFYSPEGRVMAGAGVTPDVRISVEANGTGDQALVRAIGVARSREVFELAEASRQCRIRNSAEESDSMMGPIAKLGK